MSASTIQKTLEIFLTFLRSIHSLVLALPRRQLSRLAPPPPLLLRRQHPSSSVSTRVCCAECVRSSSVRIRLPTQAYPSASPRTASLSTLWLQSKRHFRCLTTRRRPRLRF